MMYSYPFYSFPRFKRYPSYYHPTFNSISYAKSIDKIKEDTKKSSPHDIRKRIPSDTNENMKSVKNEDVLFEIFGLKLFYDDVLLICLIFFLYQEGVDDQYLFVALILLLLS